MLYIGQAKPWLLLMIVVVMWCVWRVVVQADGQVVRVNEFLPDPTGADTEAEFIELINTGSDEINIGGWKLDDADGGSGPFTIPGGTTIPGGGMTVFFSSQTQIALNNSGGDMVRILDSSGAVLFSFAYTTTHAGKSYIRDGDTFVETDTPTPGDSNPGAPSNAVPVVVIDGPINGLVGQSLAFSGSGSSDTDGDALTYGWDFGDGEVGTGVVVSHAWETSGVFVVTLTVNDGAEAAQTTQAVIITTPVYSEAVVINEFLPNPTGADAGHEFTELLNTSSAGVDVTGWKVDDIENGGSSPQAIPAGTTIEPGGFYVFQSSGLALNNDADVVRLMAPDGAVKSQTTYTSSSEGQSHNRLADGSYVLSSIVTPGAVNVIPPPPTPEIEIEVVYSAAVKINEFLPDPVGSDTELEFIELINTGSEEVHLGGWKVDDGEGGSSPYVIPVGTVVVPGAIIHFLSGQTKTSLNNGGESVRLLDPNGAVKDSASYEDSSEGVSFNRGDSGWQESTTPTPGETNVITAAAEPSGDSSSSAPKSSGSVQGAMATVVGLDAVRSLANGTLVTTQGVVSAPPGVFGSSILYLSGSGIQVYSSQGWPVYVAGDVIRVTGKMSSLSGERRILVRAATDVVKTGSGSLPEPHEVKTGEVSELYEGSLVAVSGAVTQTSGDIFYIDDGSGQVRIVTRNTTGIEKPRMQKGLAVAVVGIVSQTSAGYRVMPRWQDDLIVGEAAVATKKSASPSKKKTVSRAVSLEATALVCPTPTVCEAPVVMNQPGSRVTPTMVFSACLVAMVLMVMGFQAGEPLLALTA